MRIGDLRACKDCTVFLREAYSSQHKLLALDTFFKKVQRKREGSVLLRILWKNLNEDAVEVFRKKVSEGATIQEVISTSNADCMRSTLARIIKNVAKETIGVTIRASKTHLTPQAKEKAYEELYTKLDTKKGVNDILRIAKARERRRRDLGDINVIKEEGGRTITNENKIKKRWGEYFSSLFIARDHEGRGKVVNHSVLPQLDCYSPRIYKAKVSVASQKMERNKAVGSDQIPIETWRGLGDKG
ncbi:hypothetical protein Tco_0013910 [Tanacetum coccineum]